MVNVQNETSLVNFVCLVFELGDKTLTLSPMENLMVKCNLILDTHIPLSAFDYVQKLQNFSHSLWHLKGH